MSSLLSVHGAVVGHGLLVPLALPWLGEAWGTQRGWALAPLPCGECGMWAPILLQKRNPEKNTFLRKIGFPMEKELTGAAKWLFLQQGQNRSVGSPGQVSQGPFGGCGAGLGTATALGLPMGLHWNHQATAQEDLAHCQHMRDRE